MRCPRCRQDAPLVYRGLLAYCAACNAPRRPLSARAVNLAGQPSQLGGRLGMIFGWIVLGGGILLASAVILLLQLLVPTAMLGYAIGLPVALITTVVGLLILLSSRRLRSSGVDEERRTRTEAVQALAKHRGGAVTAEDAGRSLGIDRQEADELLGFLSETQPELVQLELDEDGNLFYVFPESATQPHLGAKYRVEAGGKVRVSDPFEERLAEKMAEEEAEAPRLATPRR